jgi:O-antigen ligase
MILAWLIALGVSGYLVLRNRRGRLFASFALAIVSAGVALSGSRGAFLWTLGSGMVCAAAFLWGAPWSQGQGLRVVRTIQRALLVGGLAMVILFLAYPQALLSRVAFYSETLSLDSPQSELVYRVRDYPLQNFLLAFRYERWPYGFGIGTASLGVQYVSRIMHAPPMYIGVVNGYGDIVIEMGIVGLALWLVMSLAVIFTCWRVVRKLKGSPWFPLGFVIFWFAFLLLFPFTFNGLQPYQNFVLNAYLWLLVGILFRLPGLEFSDQNTSAAAAATPRGRWIR